MKPSIIIEPNGPTGNIFMVMGLARKELKVLGQNDDAKLMIERVSKAGSYENALEIIEEYVNIIRV